MKNPFPQFGSGKGMKKTNSHYSGMGRELKKTFPKFGNRKGMEKNPVPKFRSGKGTKKTYSHNSGTGIRGFHSWEWTGTGIPAYP